MILNAICRAAWHRCSWPTNSMILERPVVWLSPNQLAGHGHRCGPLHSHCADRLLWDSGGADTHQPLLLSIPHLQLSPPLLPPQILSQNSSPLGTLVLPLLLPLLPASNLSCSLQKNLPDFGLAATASLPSSWAPSPTPCQPSSGRACALYARQLLEGHFGGASHVYIRSWHVQLTPQIICPHIIYNGWYTLSLNNNNNKSNKQ